MGGSPSSRNELTSLKEAIKEARKNAVAEKEANQIMRSTVDAMAERSQAVQRDLGELRSFSTGLGKKLEQVVRHEAARKTVVIAQVEDLKGIQSSMRQEIMELREFVSEVLQAVESNHKKGSEQITAGVESLSKRLPPPTTDELVKEQTDVGFWRHHQNHVLEVSTKIAALESHVKQELLGVLHKVDTNSQKVDTNATNSTRTSSEDATAERLETLAAVVRKNSQRIQVLETEIDKFQIDMEPFPTWPVNVDPVNMASFAETENLRNCGGLSLRGTSRDAQSDGYTSTRDGRLPQEREGVSERNGEPVAEWGWLSCVTPRSHPSRQDAAHKLPSRRLRLEVDRYSRSSDESIGRSNDGSIDYQHEKETMDFYTQVHKV